MSAPSPTSAPSHLALPRPPPAWRLRLNPGRLGLAIALSLGLTYTPGCYEAPLPENPDVIWLRESPPPVPEGEFCVVSDEPSKKGFTVDYKGKKIYLCCKKCVRSFAAEPERYVGTGG